MSADHGSRAHALWSASSTAANLACPGRLALTEHYRDKESEAAAWGTACHQVAEEALREQRNAVFYLGQTIRTKAFSFDFDEEMAETTQVYLDYVRQRQESGGELQIEQRFRLDDLNPPLPAGGTADAVLWFPAEGLLEVVDLKCGRGVVVEAKGNAQARTYAIGAVLARSDVRPKMVRSTIVQPRAGHRDGTIRSETIEVLDLYDWTTELLAGMEETAEARRTFQAGGVTDEWAETWLRPGDSACKFCPATATCPALKKKAMEKARVVFDGVETGGANAPDSLMPEEIADILDHADLIESWLNAVRAYAHEQVSLGVNIPGYILVPKTARGKWKDDATVRAALLLEFDLADVDILDEPKMKTPAAVKKILKDALKDKDALARFEALVSRESSGDNLVRADKTTRKKSTKTTANLFGDVETAGE